MKTEVLKESLGIDVSKDSLSFCLGVLHSDLTKQFKVSSDVDNDDHGFNQLGRWIRKNKS